MVGTVLELAIICIRLIVIIFIITRNLTSHHSILFSSLVFILRQVLPHGSKMAARHSRLYPTPQMSQPKESLSFSSLKLQQKFWSGFVQPGFKLCPFLYQSLGPGI